MGLVDNPDPPGSAILTGNGGCYYIAIDDWYILYHIDADEAAGDESRPPDLVPC